MPVAAKIKKEKPKNGGIRTNWSHKCGTSKKMLVKFIPCLNLWTTYLDNYVGKISSDIQNTKLPSQFDRNSEYGDMLLGHSSLDQEFRLTHFKNKQRGLHRALLL
jgi:hypothetical protein